MNYKAHLCSALYIYVAILLVHLLITTIIMRSYHLFPLLLLLSACSTIAPSNTAKSPTTTVFEEAYYQDLEKNIVRLHHLLQGTFTAHTGSKSAELTSWTVSEGDSVVLYSVPLGEPSKNGYWIYSYEFMTSLPDAPIYTSIKRLQQINRDTVDVYYYTSKKPLHICLLDLLDVRRLNAKIDWEQLEQQEKRVRYARQSSSHFIGTSLVYEDPDRHCWRQNTYDLSPNFYQVKTTFYDKDQHTPLDIKKRPNLLVRRAIESKVLHKLATEG